jgi:hypothetical protein
LHLAGIIREAVCVVGTCSGNALVIHV